MLQNSKHFNSCLFALHRIFLHSPVIKFRMVYKEDGNPQLDSLDWSMYSNILKVPWFLLLQKVSIKLPQENVKAQNPLIHPTLIQLKSCDLHVCWRSNLTKTDQFCSNISVYLCHCTAFTSQN